MKSPTKEFIRVFVSTCGCNDFLDQVKIIASYLRTRVSSSSQDIEELIADFMTSLLIRAERLNEFDQLAISEEFREWLNEGVRLEDVLKLAVIKK